MQDLLSWIHTLSIHLSNDQRQNNPTSPDLYCQRTASCRTVLSESSTKGIIKLALEWKKCWGASGYIASTSHDFGWFQEMLANMRLFSTKEAGKHEETWSLIHWYTRKIVKWQCKWCGWNCCSFIDPIPGNLLPRFECKRMTFKGSGLGELQSAHQQMQRLLLDK